VCAFRQTGSSASSRRGSVRSRVAEEGAAPAVEQWERARAIVHEQLEATAWAEPATSSAAIGNQPLGAEAAQHAAKLLAKMGRAEVSADAWMSPLVWVAVRCRFLYFVCASSQLKKGSAFVQD
jgi:hypothetical protein